MVQASSIRETVALTGPSNALDDLPEFQERYLQFFDPYAKTYEVRRRSVAQGNATLNEAIELITQLLKKYQLSYIPNTVDRTLLLFPFMFRKPEVGQKIRNITTGEVYTIKQLIDNPETKTWEGLIKLDLINAPILESSHSLEYLNSENYVPFNHEFPDSLPNLIGANSERILKSPPPISPTVTWTVARVEPGSVGQVFDSRKEYKPRLRESVKDPLIQGHTVEVYGQWYDNIVQFDCWSNDHRTSYRLVRWIEQFMKLYSGYLRQCGVVNLFFWKRSEEGMNNAWRQAFPIRSTQFYIRTEELEAVYRRDILRMNVNIKAQSSNPEPLENSLVMYIADQQTSGGYTPQEYHDLFYRSGQYLFGSVEIRQ